MTARTRNRPDSTEHEPDQWCDPVDLVSPSRRTVSTRALTDPRIYRLEMERVFNRSWVFIGHESEVPRPGDFVNRFIGEDPVIMVRDRSGEINVLLNICSHRSAQVAGGEAGTVKAFQCPYHNWLYDTAGALIGVPAERHAFPDGIDKAALGLPRARSGVYHGMVFATWNEHAPSLAERFADMDFYYRMFFGLLDNGFEVAGPPLRWVEHSNWKFPAENLSGDGYHLMYVHKFLGEMDLIPGWDNPAMAAGITSVSDEPTGDGFQLGNFEQMPEGSLDERLPLATSFFGLPAELAPQIKQRLTDTQLEIFCSGISAAGNIFPNLSYTGLPFTSYDDSGVGFQRLLRMSQPLGPDRHMVWMWVLLPRDADPELKERQRLTTMRSFSVAGMVESDDGEVLMRGQRGINGPQGRRRELTYLSQGTPNRSWPGPGTARTGFPDEVNQFNFWTRWRQLMGERHESDETTEESP